MPVVIHSFSRSGYEESGQRQYAVVIYLPRPLEEIIAPLRERFDPEYNLISAHISLVFPFESARTLDELSEIVRAETEQLESLKIQLGSIGDFYPVAPIIFWHVKKSDVLLRLHKQLYARLGLPLPYKEFVPHVTVAKEISQHRVVLVKDEIASYLPDESFDVKALDLVSPVADDHWVSVRTFPVASAGEGQ